MFISEIKQACSRENQSPSSPKQGTDSANIRNQLAEWQQLPNLSPDTIRHINNVFYEFAKSEVTQFIVRDDIDSWKKSEGHTLAEHFIKLLIPSEYTDIAEKLKAEFWRQDMQERLLYIFSQIGDIIKKHADKTASSGNAQPASAADISTPLDSAKNFMQFMNNHLADCNWQKISCARNHKASSKRQQALLEIEYKQCQYTPGEPEYALWENKYRDLTAQIEADYSVSPIGHNTGFSPWPIRNVLKNCVTVVTNREQKKQWTWQTYCSLKEALNSKTRQHKTSQLSLPPLREMDSFKN